LHDLEFLNSVLKLLHESRKCVIEFFGNVLGFGDSIFIV